ncbi:MAG: class I SAM-dependent methyltransferase [Verrucomicrobiota bacterium]
MENRREAWNEHESACARVASHFSERWLRGYVASKLRRDPVYPAAYELLRDSTKPLLDVGCGVGLLSFYLRERGCAQPMVGVDVDARKIQRATNIAAAQYAGINFRNDDAQKPMADFAGDIALFDLLHYLPIGPQKSLLEHLASCVARGGLLLIRDCPREGNARFWATWLAEKIAQLISWNLNAPLHFPSRVTIKTIMTEQHFDCESRPLWGNTPFNNYLFIFRRTSNASGAGMTH